MENKPAYAVTPPPPPIDTRRDRAVKLLLKALGDGRPFILIVEAGEVRAFYLNKAGRVPV